jgi:acetylornithine deacetylase/succinyl-diaminopimelate desuccinylase-like protein
MSEALESLCEFLRIPTISVDPRYAAQVRRGADWLARYLSRIGMQHAQVMATGRHPCVYADWLHAVGRPTLLIYGHYDVQPVEPLSEWRSPPFQPNISGDYLHARGASDDKGQLFAHVCAIQQCLASGALPVNVRCFFEGEEEIGSPSLLAFIRSHRGLLHADHAVVSDTRMLGPNRPTITYSLRGTLAVLLEVTGPRRDLHAGTFGGAVHNPLQALSEIIAGLHDPATRRVNVPGFYDSVLAVSSPDHAPTSAGWGERGYSNYARTTIRPALTLNGITGGHQGPGSKAVIPRRAIARLSFRLVPNQDPHEVDRLFRQHLTRCTPPTVRTRVQRGVAVPPVVLSVRDPSFTAASRALRRAFGRAPTLNRSGGTIPAIGLFQRELGLNTVLMGFGLPGEATHAPNERLHLPTFARAQTACATFLSELTRL